MTELNLKNKQVFNSVCVKILSSLLLMILDKVHDRCLYVKIILFRHILIVPTSSFRCPKRLMSVFIETITYLAEYGICNVDSSTQCTIVWLHSIKSPYFTTLLFKCILSACQTCFKKEIWPSSE